MFKCELIDGVTDTYFSTEFGSIQHKLNVQVLDTMKKNESGDASAGDVAE